METWAASFSLDFSSREGPHRLVFLFCPGSFFPPPHFFVVFPTGPEGLLLRTLVGESFYPFFVPFQGPRRRLFFVFRSGQMALPRDGGPLSLGQRYAISPFRSASTSADTLAIPLLTENSLFSVLGAPLLPKGWFFPRAPFFPRCFYSAQRGVFIRLEVSSPFCRRLPPWPGLSPFQPLPFRRRSFFPPGVDRSPFFSFPPPQDVLSYSPPLIRIYWSSFFFPGRVFFWCSPGLETQRQVDSGPLTFSLRVEAPPLSMPRLF